MTVHVRFGDEYVERLVEGERPMMVKPRFELRSSTASNCGEKVYVWELVEGVTWWRRIPITPGSTFSCPAWVFWAGGCRFPDG